MVPFDVVRGRDDMPCNSGGVTILCKSFEMFSFPVMHSSFGFTDVERIKVPTTSFVYYFRPLKTYGNQFVSIRRMLCLCFVLILNFQGLQMSEKKLS